MKCPACFWDLQYKGGENKEDFGCPNRKCKSLDIHYYTNVKVRDGWYFAAGYNLPFEYIDTHWNRPDYNYHWYALVGPVGNETQLQGLKLIEKGYGTGTGVWNNDTQDYSASTWKECSQEVLYSIPYYALPANGDFTHQFSILRDRVIREWFDKYSESDHYKSNHQDPYKYVYDWYHTYFNFDWFGTYNNNYDNHKSKYWHSYNIDTDTQLDIDDTTKALIELAANNTNDNEASVAAVQACKRLRKQIKKDQ